MCPNVDFDALSTAFKNLEAEYSDQIREEASGPREHQNDDSVLRDPRVLCISSDQYLQLGFANQLQTVLDAFPKELRHDVVTSSKEAVRILSSQQVDVVHIAATCVREPGPCSSAEWSCRWGARRPRTRISFRRRPRHAARWRAHAAGGYRQRRLVGVGNRAAAPDERDLASRHHQRQGDGRVGANVLYGTSDQDNRRGMRAPTAQSKASMKLLTQQVASPIKMTWKADASSSSS